MGYFFEMCEIVNRTSKPLNVRFDGQDVTLDPNYDTEGQRLLDVHNMIPVIAAPYAKSQNVRMGSENPEDPSDYEVLVGVVAKKGQKQKDDLGFLEQDDTVLTRVNLQEMLADDPSVKDIRVAGKRNQPRARKTEADIPGQVDTTAFRRA